jgi:mannose-1-phosphate guanylyltransferase
LRKDTPYIVIMAGGKGSRFWPYSRVAKPKQFLDLLGTGRTLLQMTYDRFLMISEPSKFYVVTHEDYFDLVKNQLPDILEHQILKEPINRNTACCVAYASYKIHSKDPHAKVIVTPTDHLILKEDNFKQRINDALEDSVIDHHLVTIGIQPNRPDTGYGYIQYIEEDHQNAKKVKTFTEKPDAQLAQTFLDSGDFVWNSGIFVWKAESIIAALEKYMPELAEVFQDGVQLFDSEHEAGFVKKAYTFVKNVSIDHGLMEKADNVYVILADFGWSDIGSWRSRYEIMPKDEHQNAIEANVLLYDTSNCLIRVSPEKLVVVQGLKNCLITESDNVLLICNLNEEKKFREFFHDAKSKGEQFL